MQDYTEISGEESFFIYAYFSEKEIFSKVGDAVSIVGTCKEMLA